MTDYLAFHNDPALAEKIRTQVDAHAAADEIIQGAYWENGKGCFIGCIAHGSSVATVKDLTGFPIMLTRIAERIFEGLPNDIAKGFPQRVISAPRIGADLRLVAWKFLSWCVADALDQFGTPAVRTGCTGAVQLLSDLANGREISIDAAAYAAYAAAYAAHAAADAARAAADAAAYAARAAADAAAYAADAAADAAAYAADAAADAADAAAYAADAAAYAAARAAAYARIRQADKLVELLAAA